MLATAEFKHRLAYLSYTTEGRRRVGGARYTSRSKFHRARHEKVLTHEVVMEILTGQGIELCPERGKAFGLGGALALA